MIYLSQEYLKECLHYNQNTGVFTWKRRPLRHFKALHGQRIFNSNYAGNVTGSQDARGYLQIRLDGKIWKAHRLAFLYMTGSMPALEVDHINGLPGDNRWVNLREVTKSENMRNASRTNATLSGKTGVDFRSNSWRARIHYKGTEISKQFSSKEEAIEFREFLEEELGFTPRHGQSSEHGYDIFSSTLL